MLVSLEVRDFVHISHARLELPPAGFCALTGETGVGKSLLVDALALTLGERLTRDVLRTGAEQAEVSAGFDLSGSVAARHWLQEQGMGDGAELVVRRRVDGNRRSRTQINGVMATLGQLNSLVGKLVGVCGQHEHLRLRDAGRRREFLDAAAGAANEARATAAAYDEWLAAQQRVAQRQELAAAAAAKIEAVEEALAEAKAIGLDSDSWVANRDMLAQQGNAAEVQSAHAAVSQGLEETTRILAECGRQAEVLAEYMPSAEISARLGELEALADDVARECAKLGERIGPVDEETLREAEGFVAEVQRLVRKHKVAGPEALLEKFAQLEKELAELESVDVSAALREQEQALQSWRERAAELTARRAATARELAGKVKDSLARLGMPGARFEIELSKLDKPARFGAEEIGFKFAARKTGPLRLLEDGASGGELSRVSLALFAHAGADAGKDLVFDEVDTGVGGKAAAHVGELLAGLGSERLVLCVTHLPQVAAAASHHWRVGVDADGLAGIELVEGAEREEEIARMLAGRKVTQASRNNARDILASAAA